MSGGLQIERIQEQMPERSETETRADVARRFGMPGGDPATMTTRSPSLTRPEASSDLSTCWAIWSVCRAIGTR